MARYRVCFDGKWQADFDGLDAALEWGREVAETGRLVHVARSGLLRTKLVRVLPENRFEEGERLWRARIVSDGGGGSGVVGP